jgi:hypothetical protein
MQIREGMEGIVYRNLLAAGAGLLLSGWGAFAQAPAAKTGSEPNQLEFGFDQRIRTEDWNNVLDTSNKYDDEREQIRYRTRVWMQLPVSQGITFFTSLNQETNQKMGKVNQFDEVIFDQTYLDFHPAFMKGWSLRVGRQNIMRGEGFVLFDGTSGDGSRTQYFNAAILGRDFHKSRVELIGIFDPARDRFLPRVHDQRKLLQEWNESALGTYITDDHLKNTKLDAYYFYKKEYGDTRAPSNSQFQPDRHVQTAGGRAAVKLRDGWSVAGEFAGQWGFERPRREISGWGGYGYVKKTLDTKWRPYAQTGYWAMSSGWDPIFSRWPKWSELVIYTQVRERGVSYWTNMKMAQVEVGCQPNKKVTARATYYHTTAFNRFQGSSSMFGQGLGRGDNFQAMVTATFNEHWKGHALYECLLPGNFYANRNYGYFVRFEMAYQLKVHPKRDK